jgi:HSP90 family molecular chaperone
MSENSETVEQPTTMSFKAEVQQVLYILAHSLYTDREIFLRELISNASDALNRIQFEMLTNRDVREPEAELAIWITADSEARTITIRDSGIGMSRDELVENLGTIAQSSARAFVQRAKEQQTNASEIIGQFGVGFYSTFMVADRVTVASSSYRPDDEAGQWESTGGNDFTIAAAEHEQRGTTITLHLKEDAAEFANDWRLEQIIKRHSDFVAFPIYIGDRQINQQKALWRRAPREVETEQYHDLYRQLTLDYENPLLQMHLSTDAPVDLHSILYIPSRRERGMIERRIEGTIKLYSRKVLIQDETKDLLPNYFRFVEGVIDSEDLPLNVSRESVQSSAVMQRIKKTLTGRLHRELNELATNDSEKFAHFWREFGPLIKEGVATDFENRDELLKLLRFNSTTSGEELITLADYKGRVIEGQQEIYYVMAASLEAAQNSPHLDPFRERGIEVLLFTDLMDGFMLSGLRDFEGMRLRNVDEPDLELPGEPQEQADGISEEEFKRLQTAISAALGAGIKEVRSSKVLRSNPIRLVAGDTMPGREMQRIQQLLGRDTEAPERIIEINPAHPIVVGLAQRVTADADDPLAAAIIEQLYDNALLIEGLHNDPAKMVPRLQRLLEAVSSGKPDSDSA